MASRSTAPAGTTQTAEPDGALLRIAVPDGAWAETLPPVPDGFAVTVSFSRAAARDEHADALRLLGYQVVDGPAWPADAGVAWVLVSPTLARSHPRWWGVVRGQADRAYALALGPVQRLLDPLWRAHLSSSAP